MNIACELPSGRTDGDSWNITESVGTTALGVAALRAIETRREDPLIRDEFAGLLASAAGPQWARMADGQLEWPTGDDHSRREFELAVDYQAVRTHFFDAYFADAAKAGIAQIVILASGLDSRAFRLDWPADAVVFEIDQPKVLEYKAQTLHAHNISPRIEWVPVGVDLRDDWTSALVEAGFVRGRPTTWLAEGLLPYLPADAQARLFDIVTELSGAGSILAVEAFALDDGQLSDEQRRARRQRQSRMRETLNTGSVDIEALLYREPDRPDAAPMLVARGWKVHSVNSRDEMARLGRPLDAALAAEAMTSELITARLGKGIR